MADKEAPLKATTPFANLPIIQQKRRSDCSGPFQNGQLKDSSSKRVAETSGSLLLEYTAQNPKIQ